MFFRSKQPADQSAKVSVIIPSYNHERFIKSAVDSVLNQTYANLELIVIDDGSRDRSVEILKEYSDPRFQLVVQENRGAHNTINRGLEMAAGDYLAILNSDDVFDKKRLEKCVGFLQSHPDVHLVSSYIDVINADGKVTGTKKGWKNMEPWPATDPKKSFARSDNFIKNLLMGNFIATTSNMVFTKKLYREIGGMRNLRFAHDWDFALRAAEFGECGLIEEPLMQYRIHSTNTINTNRKHMLFEVCWIYAANIHRFEGKRIFTGQDDIRELEEIAASFNFQNNDRVVWLLRSYILSAKNRGVEEPELALLDNAALRESFFPYINE